MADGDHELQISTKNIFALISQAPSDTLEQMDYLLERIAALQPDAGTPARLSLFRDSALAAAVGPSELNFLIESLEGQELISNSGVNEQGGTYNVQLTAAGWTRLRVLRQNGGLDSDIAFVAMSFDPALRDLFERGIEPGVRAAGYRPMRVDSEHHNQLIDNRIVALLRRSRFVVAEFTKNSPGVYFEAGFAVGAARHVIWLCRDTKEDRGVLHFDTNHYNHLFWSDIDGLVLQLRDRIAATVGWGPNSRRA